MTTLSQRLQELSKTGICAVAIAQKMENDYSIKFIFSSKKTSPSQYADDDCVFYAAANGVLIWWKDFWNEETQEWTITIGSSENV